MQFESEYHFSFENLKVYQKAMDFGEVVNELVEQFPKKEYIGCHLNFPAPQIP
ncbi:four helix bundle protein [Nonlabens sp. MB-3u-79]|uniref:four helix bundle protein n=1 Tax=Nonlabens sp. MB-3u-79 TaxID=2058134 RepID=UPI0026891BB6|nr:four helix bundle protein [Nonlabens sp. MB-3u-79]